MDLITICCYGIRYTHNASIINESMQCSFFIPNPFGGSDDAGKFGQVEFEEMDVGRWVLFLNFFDGGIGLVFAARTHIHFGSASCQANDGLIAAIVF